MTAKERLEVLREIEHEYGLNDRLLIRLIAETEAEARAQEAGESDNAMLDWLDKNGIVDTTTWELEDEEDYFPLRRAILAAMRAERGEGEAT